jgi:hypothetical protein
MADMGIALTGAESQKNAGAEDKTPLMGVLGGGNV